MEYNGTFIVFIVSFLFYGIGINGRRKHFRPSVKILNERITSPLILCPHIALKFFRRFDNDYDRLPFIVPVNNKQSRV